MLNLTEAITYYQEAVTRSPPGHPLHSVALTKLADADLYLFDLSDNLKDLDESIMLYEQVTNDLAASFKKRLDPAIHWADVARVYHHNSIIRAYSTSLRLLDRCLISYPDVD